MPVKPTMPTDSAERNEFPMADGLLYYFPNALREVSRVSKIGNDQHNPGEPMHWAREKSRDHANKIIRHLADAGTMDKDDTRHSAKVAWRALALLEDELIAEGATPGRNATVMAPRYLVDLSGGTPPFCLDGPSVSRHSTEGFTEVLSTEESP